MSDNSEEDKKTLNTKISNRKILKKENLNSIEDHNHTHLNDNLNNITDKSEEKLNPYTEEKFKAEDHSNNFFSLGNKQSNPYIKFDRKLRRPSIKLNRISKNAIFDRRESSSSDQSNINFNIL